MEHVVEYVIEFDLKSLWKATHSYPLHAHCGIHSGIIWFSNCRF